MCYNYLACESMIPYENKKWAAHGQPICCTWAAH